MSAQYLVSIKQQLLNFVVHTNHIQYPYILSYNNCICTTKQSLLDRIECEHPSNAFLIAMNILPIYNVLPNVIITELLSLLTPSDRIELSHSCCYFRSLIISPRGLSDLWLYIYHIPIPQIVQSAKQSSSESTFMPYMIFNMNHESSNNAQSHATSHPNTLATSAALSSQHSLQLFKTSNSSSCSDSNYGENLNAINNLKYAQYDDELKENDDDSLCNNNFNEISRFSSSVSSTSPLLQHPTNPVLASKIIYWPNYKQVLACDFPLHWKRRNTFYTNLCVLSKNCGGAHIRVFELGEDRLLQIMSRISPMLLSLCFSNTHKINVNCSAFRRMNRLLYLAYQYIDGFAECLVYIPRDIVALEFTSSSFNESSSFRTSSAYLDNIKFLQICNCRFTNYTFQRLLNLCPNIVHISVTTSSWDGTISLPSSLLSIIWKQNDGDFTISECKNVWEVALTIHDSEMIQQLQSSTSLTQLVIATPLFKGMEFLEELEKPYAFNAHPNTPFYNARSPSAQSISHISLSPTLSALSSRLNHHHFTRFDFENSPTINSGNENSGNESISNISLDSDDDDDDSCDNEDGFLRIVCWKELLQKDCFRAAFTGDRVTFYDERIINPIIQSEFKKLNAVFVQEMKKTTHMFLIAFPFF